MKFICQTYKRISILLLMLVMCSGINCIWGQSTTDVKKDSVASNDAPRAERHRIMPVPTRHKERTDPLLPPQEIGDSILPKIDTTGLYIDTTKITSDTLKADSLKADSIKAKKANAKKAKDSTAKEGEKEAAKQDAKASDKKQDSKAVAKKKEEQLDADTIGIATKGQLPSDSISTKKQEDLTPRHLTPDEIAAWSDSVERAHKETLTAQPLDTAGINSRADSLITASVKQLKISPQATKFNPDPGRALWLALVFPGAGQIYNHKYWKLPLFYGGFLGCTYALTWNNQMLRDYSQAYLDIMDDDPNTQSYMDMLPMGYNISGREERFKEIFKNKKNYYRKYRDMSIFAFGGVYILSVIDAFVDSELSTFDISDDLTLHIEPASMRDAGKISSQFTMNGVGVQCRLNF